MDNSLLVSLSHQLAAYRSMDVIANNLANVSTPGFKRMMFVLNTPSSDMMEGLFVVKKDRERATAPPEPSKARVRDSSLWGTRPSRCHGMRLLTAQGLDRQGRKYATKILDYSRLEHDPRVVLKRAIGGSRF